MHSFKVTASMLEKKEKASGNATLYSCLSKEKKSQGGEGLFGNGLGCLRP